MLIEKTGIKEETKRDRQREREGSKGGGEGGEGGGRENSKVIFSFYRFREM